MGLDMYLSTREYVSRKNYDNYDYQSNNPVPVNPAFDIIVNNIKSSNLIDQDDFTGLEISIPIGYWRKANQIHNWFVANCQDGVDECQTTWVSRDKLQELLDVCKQVMKNRKLAPELLPSGVGFFFGSTDYDEWYFNDVERTISIIQKCLQSEVDSFFYQSSW